MTHAQSKQWAEYKEDCEKQPDEELAGRMENFSNDESKARIARIVYETKQIKRQHEYQIKQIEIQNQFNTQLAERQIKANKSFLRITVIATILAAIVGAIVGGISQFAIPLLFQSSLSQKQQQPVRSHIESSSVEAHPTKDSDKVPSEPPNHR
jgi:hypothetical protein